MTEKINEMELLIPFGALGIDKKSPIPTPEDFNQWADLNARKLYVNTEITDELVEDITYYIQLWNEEDKEAEYAKEDRKPIKLYIDTIGGSLFGTLHICDIIKTSKTPVYTITKSMGYSGGVLLGIAGHKRYAYKHTSFLIHRGSFGLSGNANSNEDTTDFYLKADEKVNDYIMSNTKITKELLEINKRKEWYMFSEDALELGIIDEVLEEIL